ncbi:S26 family signal peptidase [Kitasatospora sp. NPDC004615]|uniref:S26 family signal peptidase n=1 Tax=Kitasatospora sp. NPDC004615 TaxID=3364017 RepID=UPI0036AA1BA2
MVPARTRGHWWRVALGVLGVPAASFAAALMLAVRVDDRSMNPNLGPNSRVLTVPGSGGRAERLDAVALRAPGQDTTTIRRVIGLPGDRVEITSDPRDPYHPTAGEPFVLLVQPGGSGQWFRVDLPTGRGQDRPASPCCSADGRGQPTAAAPLVPPGKLFVIGDYSEVAEDSRAYGWVDEAAVTGRVGWAVLPLLDNGPLPYDADLVAVDPPPGS